MITEGATKKVFQLTVPLKSVHDNNLCFKKEICIFEHLQKLKTIQIFFHLVLFTF
jgi:hypothetical protein